MGMWLSATHRTKNSTVSFGTFRTFVDNEVIFKKLVYYFNCVIFRMPKSPSYNTSGILSTSTFAMYWDYGKMIIIIQIIISILSLSA